MRGELKMRTKIEIKVGNIFEFAEKRLMQKIKKGEIETYSMLDIIDKAIEVRKYLDKHKRKILIPNLNREEIKRKNKECRHRYFLKTGR